MKKTCKRLFTILMLSQTVFWLITGIFTYYSSGIYLNILLVINGFLFAIFSFYSRKNRLFKVSCFIFLAANTVLTLTDQAGIYDYIILIANVLSIISFALSLWYKKASS